MNILVTGSSGFIGSSIVDKLLMRNYKVTGIDLWFNEADLKHQLENPNFEFVKGSILDENKLKPLISKCDAIIHLAAILGTSETIERYDISSVVETNVLGTIKVLKLASENNVEKVIITSVPDVPWLNPYRITKSTMEKFAILYNKYFKLNTVVLKITNVYGPRERWLDADLGAPYNYQKVVPTFIANAIQNKPLVIYGDGEQRADYIFIDDVTEAFLKTLESNRAVGHVIPIGYGKSTSVNELADTIIKLTNSSSGKEYRFMRKGETPLNISVDTSLAEEILNFKAKTDLVTGLKKTIPYYIQKLAHKKRSKNPLLVDRS